MRTSTGSCGTDPDARRAAEGGRRPRRVPSPPARRRAALAWACLAAGVAAAAAAPGAGPAEPPAAAGDILVRARPATAQEVVPAGMPAVGAPLDGLPGVVVNAQGGADAQADLSIRGSSFSGAGLSLGGLALRQPQTEHFNAELPLPSELLGAPRVLTGLDQVRASSGFLVGGVDLGLRPLEPGGRVDVGAGYPGRNWQDARAAQPLWSEGGERLGLGLFGGRETADALDYPDNALDRRYGGAILQSAGPDRQADLVVSRQRKDFGARGYYGVTPAWPADERLDDTFVFGDSQWGDAAGDFVRAAALWRELRDRYRLFWTQPGIYANEHRSRIASAQLDGRQGVAPEVALRWRADADREDLASSALGNHKRTRAGVLLLPEWSRGGLRLSAGARGMLFSGDSPALLPQAGCEVALGRRQALFASVTEGVRQPSYTELNYESPGSLGNQGLEREESRCGEAGWRYENPAARTACRAAVFRSNSRHTVDWIKAQPDSPRWAATDVGTVAATGLELSASRAFARASLGASYAWLDKDNVTAFYGSRYVLDYPRHVAQLSAVWWISSAWSAAFVQALRWQTDTPARAGGDFGAPARLSLRYAPAWLRDAELTVGCDNVWDDDFAAFVDQRAPGRRAWASLAWTWD